MSALTAALKGGASTAPPAARQLDSASFPCIQEGVALQVEDLGLNVDDLSLNSASIAGSAPTRIQLAGSYTADYELNPHSLRSAKEVFPSSQKDDLAARNFLSEAVIGSLPKGLSLPEREKIMATTPLSPTLNLLSSLPLDRVASRSADGRKLRRHVLRGAVIVFVTAGYSSKRFILERAKELGVRSVVLDGPDSWSKALQAEGVIERFIGLDMSDASTVFERALEAVQRVKKELGELDGIACFCELAVPLASRLAEQLGLPTNTPDSIDSARDKHATRAAMEKSGLPTPRNTLITTAAQLQEASDHVGYPAVIKPIHGAASLGVLRVDSWELLQTAYERVCAELAATIVENGIVRQATENEQAQGKGLSPTILMEEYLDGSEVDVDLVFSEGQPVYGSVTDNWPTVEPYFNETGSNSPSILPSSQQRELLELAVKACQSLNLQMGVFHVEGKYTSRGARLIEVNCRMGGGPVRTMNKLCWGVDLVEEQLLCSAGIPSRPPVAPKPLMNIAEFSVNAMKSGTLRDNSFLDKYQDMPGVLYARPLLQPGSKVVCVSDGLPTWVCELMVTKPDIHEAIDFVVSIEKEIQATMSLDTLAAK